METAVSAAAQGRTMAQPEDRMEEKKPLAVYMRELGRRIAAEFSVQRDEVALLLLSRDAMLLKFLYPPELSEGSMNAFPVSGSSIAGQVARSGQGSIVNNVARVRHLSFYEQIRIDGRETPQIQKMMTAPVKTKGGKVVGVVQVSRKGPDSQDPGPNFTMQELRRLEELVQGASGDIEELMPQRF